MKFEKISYEQFAKDIDEGLPEEIIKAIWEGIKLPKRATKNSAGYDFFAPYAFKLPAGQNILIPTVMVDKDKSAYEENFKKIVSSLRIVDRLHHLPSELSGGQQQRVAIARALINMPLVLFADEPTGNLDKENADEVLELLIKTQKLLGQTLIMVTHDMSIAARADRVLKMDNGILTTVSTPSLLKMISKYPDEYLVGDFLFRIFF